MKILITNIWHDDNKGDSAIVLAMMELISSIRPVEFVALSEFDESDIRFADSLVCIKNEFPNVKIISSPWPILPVKKQLSNSFTFRLTRYIKKKILFNKIIMQQKKLLTAFFGSITNNNAAHEYSDFSYKLDSFNKELDDIDLVISKGGSFIFSDGTLTGSARLARVLFPLYISAKRSKKILIAGQSIWGLNDELSKSIALPILNYADVFVREHISHEYLKNTLGISSTVIPDFAFILSRKKTCNHPILSTLDAEKKKGSIIIGLTIRDWMFQDGNEDYLRKVLSIISYLLTQSNKYRIAIMPQVTGPVSFEDDRVVMEKLYTMASDEIRAKLLLFTDDVSPYILKEAYSRFEVMLGTRLHSVILSLSVGVPSMAISYSDHKSTGIMEMVGLTDYVCSIFEIDPNEVALKLCELIKNRKLISSNLDNVNAEMRERLRLILTEEISNDSVDTLGMQQFDLSLIEWPKKLIDCDTILFNGC